METQVVYDREQFLRHVAGDMFLAYTWSQYKLRLGADAELMLEPLFNTHVLGNSVAEAEYAEA